MIVLEALAASLPVITTKAAPWQELQERGCGWWTDISVDAIGQALMEASGLTDDALRERGRRGHQLIEMEYTWERAAQNALALYTWLREGGANPDFVRVD